MESDMKKALYTTVLSALLPLALYAQGSVSEKEIQQKDITIIHGQSTADGKSQIGERILEECSVSLPKIDDLEPEINSQSAYLKEINGDPSRNEFVKTYTATLEINYMVYQKTLIIVTTNSVKGQEPVMKVMEKNLKQTKQFTSSSSEGDLFAGRSNRQYYFSTPEAAAKDVKKRAAAWLKQQSAVLCKK
jgi:hypothetical protein